MSSDRKIIRAAGASCACGWWSLCCPPVFWMWFRVGLLHFQTWSALELPWVLDEWVRVADLLQGSSNGWSFCAVNLNVMSVFGGVKLSHSTKTFVYMFQVLSCAFSRCANKAPICNYRNRYDRSTHCRYPVNKFYVIFIQPRSIYIYNFCQGSQQ